MPEKLKTKIKEKIIHEKPYSYWRFALIDFVRIFSILVLLLLAGYALAYFIWDTLEAKTILDGGDQNIFHTLSHGLPELLLIVLIISTIMYLLYRQTDLPLVKNRFLVFGSVWVFLIIVSSALVFAVQNSNVLEQSFFNTQDQLENLPYRPKRFGALYKKGKQPNVFVGRVVKINPVTESDLKIIVKNRFEQIELVLRNDSINDLELNEDVEVILDPVNPTQVISIREVPHRPFNPFTPPLQP